MAFNREAARKEGWTDQEIDQYLTLKNQPRTDQQESTTQKIGNVFRKIGLGFVPQIGEAIGQTAISALSGAPSEYGSPEQQYRAKTQGGIFSSEQQLQRASQPTTAAIDVGKNLAGLATYSIPLGKAGLVPRLTRGGVRGGAFGVSQEGATPQSVALSAAGGAVLEPALGFLFGAKRFPLTKKGAALKTTKEATKATEAGESIHWDDLSGRIRDAVTKKFGDNPTIKKLTDTLLSEKTPPAIKPMMTEPAGVGSTAGTFEQTPTQLLDWRRQILARGGSGFLKKFLLGDSLRNKVEGEARNVISKEIHRMAPGTIQADKAYTIYSKIRGDIPAWARNIALGILAKKIVGNIIPSQVTRPITTGLTQ